MQSFGIVITTIGDGAFLAPYLRAIEAARARETVELYVIADRKTPRRLFAACDQARRQGFRVRCPSLAEQTVYLRRLGAFGRLVPWHSDHRRNIGYLMAWERRCDILISADDDNLPLANRPYFKAHGLVNTRPQARIVSTASGWFNPCRLLDVQPSGLHPRGFPYCARQATPLRSGTGASTIHVNMGLWLGHPDVDAVAWLGQRVNVRRFLGRSVVLATDTWVPINSQNTAIAQAAVPAYYFWRMGPALLGAPADRFGDIFSGYCVQACAKHLGFGVRVGSPIVRHQRNRHHALRDVTVELPWYWVLEDLGPWLREVRLEGRTYEAAMLSLTGALEEAVERWRGFIWRPATRRFFHATARHVRAWVRACRMLQQG